MKTAHLIVSALMLALVCLSAGPAAAQPYGYSVNSRGNLEGDAQNALWQVNLATGESERIGPTRFFDMEGLAFAPDGTLYGASDENKTLVTINTNSGFSSPVGGVLFNMNVPLEPMDFGMTFACDGRLLVVSAIRQSLFAASLTNGELSRIGAGGSLGAPITGIAAWGDEVYGLGQGQVRNDADRLVTAAPNLYRIDPATATAVLIGPLGPEAAPYSNAGLAFDSDGNLWALTDRLEEGRTGIASAILRIDTETGHARKIADAGAVGFESLAIMPESGCPGAEPIPSPVPPTEPSETGKPPAIPVNHPAALILLVLALLAPGLWTLSPRQR
ncbi:MAG: hypothetical protein RQ847_08090 [Wenzhouxiangellaceae bacterium]|nr:hypothetical protein [Wenzhouxiangellaceae bacterium]